MPINFVYNEIRSEVKLKKIISSCFLPFSDQIYLINQDYEIFCVKYQQRELNLIRKKINKGGDKLKSEKITPENKLEIYESVHCTYDGKNILLFCNSSLDIYDLNWEKIYQIKKENFNFTNFKIFNDKNSNFIVLFNEKILKCYQMIGLSAIKILEKIVVEDENASKEIGNPFLDYIYLAMKKFGSHSEMIGCPGKTNLYCLSETKKVNKVLENYFDENFNLNKIKFKCVGSNELIEIIKDDEDYTMNIEKLKIILLSRVPLHIATVENNTLMPLENGKNISDKLSEYIINKNSNLELLQKIIEMIKLGIYEKFLIERNTNIYVVSIVGRQSSGKSYGLNRIFGTRFNVSSSRCTDGIWVSLAEIYEGDIVKTFFIMDCEGLFSARRNDQEEMKLCLALSAVSDVMILNQDLSFNRYLNNLFNNFSKSIGRIKGKCLFEGMLYVLIRDVNRNDSKGAYDEFFSSMKEITDGKRESFLSVIFKKENQHVMCLHHFEQEVFNEEIKSIRKDDFMRLNHDRWVNGKDFLETLKITLSQIYIDDDSDIDVHKMKICCDYYFEEVMKSFFNGGKCFNLDEKKNNFKKKILIYEIEKEITLQQSEVSIENNLEDLLDEKDHFEFMQILYKEFETQVQDYSLEIHNFWIETFSLFVESFFDERITILINYFEKQLPKDENFNSTIQNYIFKLKKYFEDFVRKIKICRKLCRNCKRLCFLEVNHSKDCDCKTHHACQMICDFTSECRKNENICVLPFGHDSSHICNEGNHRCSKNCDVHCCLFSCADEINHENPIHNCKNLHPCGEPCIVENCTRKCYIDLNNPHKIHECGEKTCCNRCSLCDNPCVFENHMHDNLIKEGKNDALMLGDIKLSYHACSNEHPCEKKCEMKGVCEIGFDPVEKLWKNEFGEFPFKYFRPKETRKECKNIVPRLLVNDPLQHSCKIATHRCCFQCPECLSFCNKDIDHEDLHSTNNHRNKEMCVFVSEKGKEKINVKNEGKIRAYKIGESCQPEDCTTSCTRKGRAHYHIKKCPGLEVCPAKLNPSVKHSLESFSPYEDQVFDIWLCHSYWKSFNWDVPYSFEVFENIKKCNFACIHPSHGDENYKFCLKEAWHSDEHEFDCTHEKASSNLIDTVICIDVTGSMGSYIEKSKSAILKIVSQIKALKESSAALDLKFGLVAYRDHPPQDTSFVTKTQNLQDSAPILSFLNTLSADGGGDGPEAVLDGLNDSINMSWREKSLKFLFHIADSPPHGNEYSTSGDGFPAGCPCGLKIESIAKVINEKNIRYKLLKIGNSFILFFRKLC